MARPLWVAEVTRTQHFWHECKAYFVLRLTFIFGVHFSICSEVSWLGI